MSFERVCRYRSLNELAISMAGRLAQRLAELQKPGAVVLGDEVFIKQFLTPAVGQEGVEQNDLADGAGQQAGVCSQPLLQ